MEHGSWDYCIENALPKLVHLGLHGGLSQIVDAVQYYIDKYRAVSPSGLFRQNDGLQTQTANTGFNTLLVANFFSLAEITDTFALNTMLGGLDVMYDFVMKKDYNIYYSREDRDKLKAVPNVWKNKKFIKRSLIEEYGFCYPLIYDVAGLHRLYRMMNPEIDKKVDAIIRYISTDEYHDSIDDNYGIIISGDRKYHAMGWDAKYPGWYDVKWYMENANAPKLLFFALCISNYKITHNTKWFSSLLEYLDTYKTRNGTYIFPADWLKEKQGYAVQGNHLSFGENRRKKNWREIESTFYVSLLRQNMINVTV